MAWLARLDARARDWPLPSRWCYRAVKWTLLACGVYAWVGLWYERHPILGLIQAVIVGIGLYYELTAPHVLRRRLRRLTAGRDPKPL